MKVGILGANGSIGMRHARNVQALGHETICYDPTLANGVSRDDALDKSDAIIIATPTDCHYADVMHALASKKPVFCEKPIAKEYHHCFQEVAMVGYNLRFHSAIIEVKNWIDNGDIGTIQWANFTCGQFNKKYTDHVILNWSHEIDIAAHLVGAKHVVACSISSLNDIADIVLHPSVSVHLDYVSAPEIRQYIIVGTTGRIIVDVVRRIAWLIDADDGTVISMYEDAAGSFDADYKTEIAAFLNGEYDKGASGGEALSVLNTCLQAININNERKANV